MRDYYISRFDLNASHSVGDDKSKAHNHTFHIDAYIGRPQLENGEKVNFDILNVEKCISAFLANYEGKYLNELPEIIPFGSDIEGLGNFLYESIKRIANELKHELYQLDFADNRINCYQVSDSINLPILNTENGISNYEAILRQRLHLDRK